MLRRFFLFYLSPYFFDARTTHVTANTYRGHTHTQPLSTNHLPTPRCQNTALTLVFALAVLVPATAGAGSGASALAVLLLPSARQMESQAPAF
jgi:hypothetical protein